MAIWSRFFGSAVSTAAGVSVGGAIQPTLDPLTRELANATWALHPAMPIDPYFLAMGAAQGQIPHDVAQTIANHSGFSDDNFDHMVAIANVGPGATYAFELWRRGVIDTAGFDRALRRMGLEVEWIDDLEKIKNVLLSPAQIANAVQQGHMPDEGILPGVGPDTPPAAGYLQPPAPDGREPTSVPLTQIPLSPTTEAEHLGITRERIEVEANLAGLPPGPETLLEMWNRNYIEEDTVNAGIREGHMKTKWAHAFKRMRWGVLSAPEYAGLWLRGWITRDEAVKGGALTGHTPEQMHLLYQNRGRPLSPIQALTALVRKSPSPKGEDYPGHAGPFNEADFDLAIKRADIRTEYMPTLRHLLYAYPPLFQINRLVTAKAIDADTAKQWAINNRYAPEVVTALFEYWQTVTTPATKDTRINSAQTSAITEIRSAYILGNADAGTARRWLEAIGLEAASIDGMLPIWDVMIEVPQRDLTATQVKKAFKNLPEQWPRTRAISELEQLGYTADAANTFLDE